MRLLTLNQTNKFTLGVEVSDMVLPLQDALMKYPHEKIATTITELIASGEAGLKALQTYLEYLAEHDLTEILIAKSDVTWAPALMEPKKIICVGLNYRKHADETKAAHPDFPVLFNKFSNALTGHLSKVAVPKTTERLDYEVELGIVIGKRAKYVTEADALDYVFGYCTTNDLSARDVQKRTSQWLTGKSNDGFAPVGPYVVTKDEIANPNELRLTTKLNGEMRQNSTTADMIFNCAEIVSYISHYMTLEPGDLIMTGTPEGVIIGRPMEDRVYLKPGDEITVEVEKLGALTNYFVSEE